jgi:hypothetical protein
VTLVRFLFVTCAALSLVSSAAGADFSYVVLNDRTDHNGLVRVSSDGRSITTIADKVHGHGFAKDRSGNYIVATLDSLAKVTPAGLVSTIATAPKGSQWISVVEESTGLFLIADNEQHALWRVSPDGKSVARVWTYSKSTSSLENTSLALDGRGNALLLENSHEVRLHKIPPTGDPTVISLGHAADYSSGLLDDTQGNWLFMNYHNGELFRITPGGIVTSVGKLTGFPYNMVGLAQDPHTGEYIMSVNSTQSLIRISQSATNFATFVNDPVYLSYPTAVMVETVK